MAKDVCDILDIQNVSQAINGNQESGATGLDEDEKLTYKIYISGQNREALLVNESGVYSLIFKSNKPEAKTFKKWVTSEVLPAIRKTGYYDYTKRRVENLSEKAKIELLAIESISDNLRLHETGRLLLYGKFFNIYGLENDILPAYTENEQITQSLTALLKEFDIKLSAQKVNQLLIEKGFLEIKNRPSSKGGFKSFHSLTSVGLTYGKNLINPKNTNETQPHYYKERFKELIKSIGL